MTSTPEYDDPLEIKFSEAWEEEIADEEFIEYWNELIFPDYEMGITLVWADEFEKVPVKVYNAIEKVTFNAMARRASHYADNKIFATMNWGEYNHLKEIRKNANYEHAVLALINILYRWHYWCWEFEKSENDRITFRSEEGQIYLQNKVNDAVSALGLEY
jgi:hypothetical protein